MDMIEEEHAIGHEYNVRERCQQYGISLDNLRFRVGIDRFKYAALLLMIRFKTDYSLFDDEMIDAFFQYVLENISDKMEHLSPLACVLVYYACIEFTPPSTLTFKPDSIKLHYIRDNLFSQEDLLFKENGLKYVDLIRYIRLYESSFSISQPS